MDTFESVWECSIESSVIGKETQFSSHKNVNDIAINSVDKRFKLKPVHIHSDSHSPEILSKSSQPVPTLHESNPDGLKLNLSNKKELKNKLLNFDINRNFEDIYWLSLKEKSPKNSFSNSGVGFPPIFDKNFFKPKHGMNSYQLIKFENRYQQQLLQQQSQQQLNPNQSVSTGKLSKSNHVI
jgi:hypothetical protein